MLVYMLAYRADGLGHMIADSVGGKLKPLRNLLITEMMIAMKRINDPFLWRKPVDAIAVDPEQFFFLQLINRLLMQVADSFVQYLLQSLIPACFPEQVKYKVLRDALDIRKNDHVFRELFSFFPNLHKGFLNYFF